MDCVTCSTIGGGGGGVHMRKFNCAHVERINGFALDTLAEFTYKDQIMR